jgi:hypothetical protein
MAGVVGGDTGGTGRIQEGKTFFLLLAGEHDAALDQP